jgi:hypothetical protein
MTPRPFALHVPLAALLASWGLAGCSGGNFQSQETPDSAATTDADDGAADVAAEVSDGGDGAVDPCAADPSAAKFCVTVELDAKRPPYGPDSGAKALLLDGKGKVVLWLYDKDPGATDGVKPIAAINYPSTLGAEVATTDLPAKIAGAAVPGDYWVVAAFEDNPAARTDLNPFLPGDFVLVGTLVGKKTTYPKITLKKGSTTTTNLKLKAYRGAQFGMSATSDIRSTYADGVYKIPGDGLVLFLLYDGVYGSGGEVGVDVAIAPCVKLDPYKLTPPLVTTGFGSTAEGTHNLLVGVVDFDAVGVFPPRGLIYSEANSVTFDPNKWFGIVSPIPVRLNKVESPYKLTESTPTDYTCP